MIDFCRVGFMESLFRSARRATSASTERKVSSCVIVFSLLILSVAGENSYAQSELSPEEIVERTVERAERQVRLEAELGFQSVYVMVQDSLNGDGEIENSEALTYRRYPLEGAMFDELTHKDGRPLDEDDAREETERKVDFIEEVRKRVCRRNPRTRTGSISIAISSPATFSPTRVRKLLGTTLAGCWPLKPVKETCP